MLIYGLSGPVVRTLAFYSYRTKGKKKARKSGRFITASTGSVRNNKVCLSLPFMKEKWSAGSWARGMGGPWEPRSVWDSARSAVGLCSEQDFFFFVSFSFLPLPCLLLSFMQVDWAVDSDDAMTLPLAIMCRWKPTAYQSGDPGWLAGWNATRAYATRFSRIKYIGRDIEAFSLIKKKKKKRTRFHSNLNRECINTTDVERNTPGSSAGLRSWNGLLCHVVV